MCSRKTADYIVNNAPCVSRRVLSSCHVPDRQAMHNFAHKESEYRCCPSPKLCGPWRPCINKTRPGAKAIEGPLATWRWLLWTQPAGTDEPGTLAAKNRKEIETRRGVRKQETRKRKKEEASEDFLMMLFLSAACLTGGTTWFQPRPGTDFLNASASIYGQVLATSMDT